jgi:hypothetical protein
VTAYVLVCEFVRVRARVQTSACGCVHACERAGGRGRRWKLTAIPLVTV